MSVAWSRETNVGQQAQLGAESSVEDSEPGMGQWAQCGSDSLVQAASPVVGAMLPSPSHGAEQPNVHGKTE